MLRAVLLCVFAALRETKVVLCLCAPLGVRGSQRAGSGTTQQTTSNKQPAPRTPHPAPTNRNISILCSQMKELLLLLSGYPFDNKDKPALGRALREVSDWKPVVELINAHGIIALAAFNLNKSGLSNIVPPEAMALLDNGYKQSLARNTWLTLRWKEVNSILTDAGIKHVLLKGMALEYTVYGGRGLRQMNDNDILVRKEDVLRAWNLLKEKGFSPGMHKSSFHKDIMLEIGKHLPELTRDGYTVELHHTLFKENAYKQTAFENSKEISVDGVKAFVLPDEINLAFLKSHLMYHHDAGQYQLRLSNDIRLLNNEEFPEITEELICNPKKFQIPNHNKIRFRSQFRSLTFNSRLKYILGEVFPSVAWMKKRYKCGAVGVWFRYAHRVGKVLWLVG